MLLSVSAVAILALFVLIAPLFEGPICGGEVGIDVPAVVGRAAVPAWHVMHTSVLVQQSCLTAKMSAMLPLAAAVPPAWLVLQLQQCLAAPALNPAMLALVAELMMVAVVAVVAAGQAATDIAGSIVPAWDAHRSSWPLATAGSFL
jgi:hypothetical protein